MVLLSAVGEEDVGRGCTFERAGVVVSICVSSAALLGGASDEAVFLTPATENTSRWLRVEQRGRLQLERKPNYRFKPLKNRGRTDGILNKGDGMPLDRRVIFAE